MNTWEMANDEFEREVASQLNQLSNRHQLAFGCSCCERIAPNSRAYALEDRDEYPDAVGEILNLAWSWTSQVEPAREIVDSFITRVQQIPWDPDSHSIFGASAIQARYSVELLLGFCIDHKTERLFEISLHCRETIGEFIGLTSTYNVAILDPHRSLVDLIANSAIRDPQFDKRSKEGRQEWEFSHPMAESERAKQLWDLRLLHAAKELTPQLVDLLRQSSQACGIQPFRRGIRQLPE